MNDRSAKLLWDVRRAAGRAIEFLDGLPLDAYLANALVRSAVERQIGIIGDALAELRRRDPTAAQQVPRLNEIIGTRNILIHGYDTVDDAKVWTIVTSNLPVLIEDVSRILAPLERR